MAKNHKKKNASRIPSSGRQGTIARSISKTDNNQRLTISDVLSVRQEQHKRSFRDSLRRLYKRPFNTLLVIIVLAIAITLPLSVNVVVDNLATITGHSNAGLQLNAYLKTGVTQRDAKNLKKTLQLDPTISSITFVSAEDALLLLAKDSDIDGKEVLAGLDHNPLPATLIITLAQGKNIQSAAEKIKDQLTQNPLVDSVRMDIDWFNKVESAINFGQLLATALEIAFSLAVIFVIGNSIKVSVEERHEEIEISQLIGALNSFIRLPFLYLGALIGFLGGLVAIAIIQISISLLDSRFELLTQVYQLEFNLQGLGLLTSIQVLLLSSSLGWIGSWMMVTLYLYRTKLDN